MAKTIDIFADYESNEIIVEYSNWKGQSCKHHFESILDALVKRFKLNRTKFRMVVKDDTPTAETLEVKTEVDVEAQKRRRRRAEQERRRRESQKRSRTRTMRR